MLDIRLGLVVLAGASLGLRSAGDSLPSTQPAVADGATFPTSIWIGEARWDFSSSPNRGEVAVDVHGAMGVSQFVLPIGKELGRIVDIKAAVRRTHKLLIIGLGIVSRSQDANTLEYRMFEGRGTEDDLIAGKFWTGCGRLTTRAGDAPFSTVAVSLPGGDSLMLTLQELKRDAGNPDRIETHVFVNHCPAGDEESNAKLTAHYVSVVTAPVAEK